MSLMYLYLQNPLQNPLQFFYCLLLGREKDCLIAAYNNKFHNEAELEEFQEC